MKMKKSALSLLVLLLCASALGAGHDVTRPVPGPSALYTGSPSVATDGKTFFTVWSTQGAIYGAFADSSGQRSSLSNIQVLPLSPAWYQVTTIDNRYVLVWSD